MPRKKIEAVQVYHRPQTQDRWPGALDENPGSRWYVVELQREKAAIAEANLTAQGFRVFNPQMWVPVNQFGKVVKRLKPVFPGYCFVFCSVEHGRWREINSTRGVKRFAGPPGMAPVAVRGSIVANLIERCPEGILDTTYPVLEVGQQVKLGDCAFAGALARVHALDDMGRVKVLISLLGADRVVSVPRSSAQPTNLAF